MLDWEWYDDANTFRVFIHLLLSANHKPKNHRGISIPTGTIMTGREKLASQIGIPVQVLRTSLNRLKSTSEITINSSSKGTIIKIVKWNEYQHTNQLANQQLTSDQPATNQQLTTNKNGDKEKNEEELLFSVENPPIPKIGYAQFVDSWNEMAKSNGLPCVQTLSTSRKSKLKTRISEGIKDSWSQLLDNVSKSSFCKGNNKRGWKINFDYLIANDNNWIEIIEGKFADKPAPQSQEDELQAYLSQDAPSTSGLF